MDTPQPQEPNPPTTIQETPPTPPPFISNQRHIKMPSCAVSLEDLRILYDILAEKVKEAEVIETTDKRDRFNSLPNIPPENLRAAIKEMEDHIKESYKLVIQIRGTRGEFIASESNRVFTDVILPNEISSILLDSTIIFKFKNNNQLPDNWLSILFDFSKPSLLDPILSSTPTPNTGYVNVSGNNETWVSGVFDKISSFGKPKRKKRDWLHTSYIYDFLLFILGLPLSFWAVYKINLILNPKIVSLPNALQTSIYVFIVLIALRIFLFLFGYARWLYPLVELEDSIQSVSKKQRLFYGALALSIIGKAAYDIIKILFL